MAQYALLLKRTSISRLSSEFNEEIIESFVFFRANFVYLYPCVQRTTITLLNLY